MALPPFAGAAQETLSWLTVELDTEGAVGVAGTVVASTVELAEAEDVPAALVAVTVTVYETLEASDDTTMGEEVPVAVLVV